MPVEVDPKTGKRKWVWGVPGMQDIPMGDEGSPANPGMDLFTRKITDAATNPELWGAGGMLLGGGPEAAGVPLAMGASGAMRALRSRMEGKPFDPVEVGTTMGLNMIPGVGAETMARGKGFVGSALEKILSKLGLSVPGLMSPVDTEAAKTIVNAGLFRKGEALTSRKAASDILGRSVDLANTNQLANKPLTTALDLIAAAIQKGEALPATAMRDLQEAGVPLSTVQAELAKRLAVVGHAGLAGRSVIEGQQEIR